MAEDTEETPTAAPTIPGHSDPLLECLAITARLHGRSISPEAVTAGLPLVENSLTPALFLRAAERADFSARLVRRTIKKIPRLVLPVVLILDDNSACVLISIDDESAEIIHPDVGGGSEQIPLSELLKSYSGFAIFLKPAFAFEEQADRKRVPRPSSWFWGTLWQFRRFYLKLIPASIMINLFALASSVFIMIVYDRVVPNQAFETLWVLAAGVGVIFLFEFIFRMLRGYFIDRAGKRADVLLASALFEHIMGIEMAAKPSSSGAFASQARAYESLREFFTSATLVALVDLPFVFLFIGLIYWLGGIVALVPLTAAIVILLFGLLIQIPLRRAVSDSYQGGTQRHAILVEAITGMENIKGTAAESNFQRRMEQAVQGSSGPEIRSRWYSSMATSLTGLVNHMATVGIVIVSVYQIFKGEMTQGAMIACVILSGRGLAPLARVAGLLTRLQQSMAALRGLNVIMNLPRERLADREFITRPDFKADIDFQNVSFAYPDQKIPALSGVNLKIEAGERVALLGRIGSGKSTILRLLLKFYPPAEGLLKLSGADITQLDPAEIRRRIAFVPQDVNLFAGTVKENIVLGAPWADDSALQRAASRAGVDQFVQSHPLGYDLQVGERGANLSGGQRQAVALARAILTEPDLLLFDEPTTGMDTNAEKDFVDEIKRFLDASPDRRTLIMATHKPSLLSVVDRIVVVDQGQVVADGPRSEVLKKLTGGGRAA